MKPSIQINTSFMANNNLTFVDIWI